MHSNLFLKDMQIGNNRQYNVNHSLIVKWRRRQALTSFGQRPCFDGGHGSTTNLGPGTNGEAVQVVRKQPEQLEQPVNLWLDFCHLVRCVGRQLSGTFGDFDVVSENFKNFISCF